jgi:hypothetical protein
MTLKLLGLISVAGTSAASAALSATNLLALYDFNGNANDSSGNAPNATLESGAVISADGFGYSGNPGDSSLDVTADSAHALTTGLDVSSAISGNAMAVSFWQFNIGNGAGARSQSTSFGILGGGLEARGFGAHTTWSDGTIYFDHSGCCTQPSQRLTAGGFGDSLIDGWHHIVLQVDNGAAQIWVDGTLRSEHLAGAAPIASSLTGEVRVGLQYDGTVGFDGRLDEFAVWNTSLEESEIQALAGGASTLSLIPEPSSGLLLLLGSGLLVGRRRR